MPFSAISPCTASFLIITFNTLGNIVVDNKTYIRLVYPHTKSNGGHHHIYLLHQEHILIFGAGLCIKTCMIRNGTHPIYLEHLGQFFHSFAAQAIDDSRFSLILLHKTDDIRIYIFGFRTHLIKQIRPIERRLEHLGIRHSQVFDNVFLHLRRSSCCKANNRNIVS